MKGTIVANRYRDTYLVGNSIDLIIKVGDEIIIKTPDGYDYGIVKIVDVDLYSDSAIEGYEIERMANEKDLQVVADLAELQSGVEANFTKHLERNLLEMKYVDSFFKFDRSKIVFFFTSPDRVDFRQLVRDLATEYKSRIELRQVGVRDEAKVIGGYGMCGCSLCCNSFLKEFTTIDTNMAKVQDLIINPEKISGVCGRLMCCLAYEKDFYLKEKRCYPGVGSYYTSEKGKGYVKSMNILTGIMLLHHEDGTYEEVLVEKDCKRTLKSDRDGGNRSGNRKPNKSKNSNNSDRPRQDKPKQDRPKSNNKDAKPTDAPKGDKKKDGEKGSDNRQRPNKNNNRNKNRNNNKGSQNRDKNSPNAQKDGEKGSKKPRVNNHNKTHKGPNTNKPKPTENDQKRNDNTDQKTKESK